MKKNSSLILVAILATALLSSCAGPGAIKKIPVTMPGGQKATIIAHNQSVPDWMLSKKKLALNYMVRGDVSPVQLAAVAESERACRIYTDTVRPDNLVAVFSSGVLYAGAGYLGVGLGSHAFSGAVHAQYARYGAWATGVAGTANGVITLGGQTYTFENCGREIFDLFPEEEIRVLQKSPY